MSKAWHKQLCTQWSEIIKNDSSKATCWHEMKEWMLYVFFVLFFFVFFFVYYLNCVICSDVGSPLNPAVQALWVKQHQMRQNTKARVSFWWSKNVAKFYRKWTELLYVEAAAVFSFTKSQLTVWPLYAQNGYSGLNSGGDSHVNLVTRCLLRGSVWATGRGKYQQVSWKKWQSCCGWQFYWHSVRSTWIFVCLWTEKIWQNPYNQWFLLNKNPPCQSVYTVLLSQTRLSILVL